MSSLPPKGSEECTSKWYAPAFRSFMKDCNRSSLIYQQIQSHSKETGLSTVKSFISVGPADGDIECEMLQNLMPSCSTFLAIEPNPDFREMLKRNIHQKCHETKLVVVPDYVENWRGPPEQVQLLLLSNVALFFNGEHEEGLGLLRRCLNWVAPGGKMIVVIETQELSNAKAAFALGTGYGTYFEHDLRRDLKSLNVHYTEDSFTMAYAWNFDEDMVNMYWHKEATEHEKAVLEHYLKLHFPQQHEEQEYYSFIISSS